VGEHPAVDHLSLVVLTTHGDKAVAGASWFGPRWGILLTPVPGLGASRAAGLNLAVWRQSTVAVPGRSPSSHDPTPHGSWPRYSSNEAPTNLPGGLAIGQFAPVIGLPGAGAGTCTLAIMYSA
jgi:hypothetical protein